MSDKNWTLNDMPDLTGKVTIVTGANSGIGFETQMGVHHLGHFALTGLLVDLLLKTPNSRVVNVSSIGHRFGKMDFDNLLYADGKGYSTVQAYRRSKLANLLFTYELQRCFDRLGAKSIAVAAHPGAAETNIGGELNEKWAMRLLISLTKRLGLWQSAADCALPTLRAAVDPAVQGGDYYGPDGFWEQTGYPVKVESNDASHNLEDAQRLWEVSQELTGVYYQQLA